MKKEQQFEVRDLRTKEKFVIDDLYLNGYAKKCGIYATGVYLSLCRHADKQQKSFPSHQRIAEELAISRSQVIRSIKILEENGIVTKERVGKKANNRYYLLDKSSWGDVSTSNISDVPTSDITSVPQEHHHVSTSNIHSKETHKKETHSKEIVSADTTESVPHGNETINILIEHFQETIKGSLDGTQQENRRYCFLLLKRFGKDFPNRDPQELIQLLITQGSGDRFHGKNMTNFKYLYYNAQKIIKSLMGDLNKNRITKIS